jgi:FKBP-type peptidyl-prolyl cis-trans isomerase
MRKISLAILALTLVTVVASCGDSWKKLPGGKQYMTLKHGDKHKKLSANAYVFIRQLQYLNDTLVMDSYKDNPEGVPVMLTPKDPKKPMDINDVLLDACVGDSIAFLMPTDTILAHNPEMAQFMKPAGVVKLIVVIKKTMTQQETEKMNAQQKAMQDAMQAQMKQEMEDNADPVKQAAKIQEFIKRAQLKDVQNVQGVFKSVFAKGFGNPIANGAHVVVNYTGRFLNNQPFDSNIDPQFGHAQPMEMEVGNGKVIKGWEIALRSMKKGEKAVVVIPSDLGYGKDGNQGIPPNSPLIFELEILDVK